MKPIYLFVGAFHIYKGTNQKRPGPKVEKDMRARLDAAGLKLLDRVMANQFDLPDTAELERQHLLAQSWGPGWAEQRDLPLCIAEYHPRVAQALPGDAARLILTLAQAHTAKADKAGRAFLADLERRLDGLDHDIPERDFHPLFDELFALEPPTFSNPIAGGLAVQLQQSVQNTLIAWRLMLGDEQMKKLSRTMAVWTELEAAFGCVDRKLKPLARPWAQARLLEHLRGNAGPIAVPPELLR